MQYKNALHTATATTTTTPTTTLLLLLALQASPIVKCGVVKAQDLRDREDWQNHGLREFGASLFRDFWFRVGTWGL